MSMISTILSSLVLIIVIAIFIEQRKKGTTPEITSSVESISILRDQLKLNIESIILSLQTHRDELRSSLSGILSTNHSIVDSRLDSFKKSMDGNAQLSRQDASSGRDELEKSLANSLRAVEIKIAELTEANSKKQLEIIDTLQKELEKLRKENELKLEQMRTTVDEKLQGTLDKRLGESFKTVSDQLKQVYEGLGEMQTLASGVGDLKRVLTNVKNRGGWGEVQLGRQLEDMLSPEQFEHNVMIDPSSREIVEYAIKLPGQDGEKNVYLPIDAKFPQEDYERLLTAQESGTAEDIERAGIAVEKAIKQSAKDIADKYLRPPFSTDFGIMYLPTEGLFAEVIRRPGLSSELQSKYHVLVTGPTTLMAILNSLQMGFKTLAVQKQTSDLWRVLAAAQSEFKKYGSVWEKLEKQLGTAQNTVKDARVGTKRIEKTFQKMESIDRQEPIIDLEIEDFTISDLDLE